MMYTIETDLPLHLTATSLHIVNRSPYYDVTLSTEADVAALLALLQQAASHYFTCRFVVTHAHTVHKTNVLLHHVTQQQLTLPLGHTLIIDKIDAASHRLF